MENTVTTSRRLERPVPKDTPSTFGLDELFFSTTDPASRIVSCNSVFTRVSKYSDDELIGKAHNRIRHPDMPRSVFRLFWNRLEAGQSVCAYVKNMAKDGSWYWVFAFATPINNEFLSVRLLPTSELFPKVKQLYAELRELELNVESRDLTASTMELREEAIQIATIRLNERLAEWGYPDYSTFMHSALTKELLSRDAALNAPEFVPTRGSYIDPNAVLPPEEHRAERERWGTSHQAFGQLRVILDGLMDRVEYFDKCDQVLSSKSTFLSGLAESIRVFSLNAILACDALHTGGETLTAVASLMRDRSNAISGMIDDLTASLKEFSASVEHVGYCIGASQLQADMATQYLLGVVNDGIAERDLPRNVNLLTKSALATNEPISELLVKLIAISHRIVGCVSQVRRELSVLQVLHVNGRVESAPVPNNGAIISLFQNIGEQVRNAQVEMEEFTIVESFFQLEKIARDGKLNKALDKVTEETTRASGW